MSEEIPTNRAVEDYSEMLKALEGYFRDILTIKSKDGRRELRVKFIKLPAIPRQDNFETQKRARSLGLTMSKPLTADLELVENGKVLDRKEVILLSVPEVTQRGTYIVQGSEYIFPLQKRLIPGVYTTKKNNGTVTTWINSAAGRNYTVVLGDNGMFHLEIKHSTEKSSKLYKLALYPLLRAFGYTDQQMLAAWGPEVTQIQIANKDGQDVEKALKTLYNALRYETDPEVKTQDVPGYLAWIMEYLENRSELDPDNAVITTGKPYKKVEPEVFFNAATKALEVMRGDKEEDNKESLVHGQIMAISDFAVERLKDRQYRQTIKTKLARGVETRRKIDDIVYKDIFQKPFTSVFTQTSLARTPKQTNPMDMLSSATELTIMGEGGIQTAQAVTFDVRAVDPSHLGFIDPIQTPEGSNIGTTLHLSGGARKHGKELQTRLIDPKTGKTVWLNPRQFYSAVVAFSDFFDKKTLKFKPDSTGMVQAFHKHRDVKVRPQEVQYVMRSIGDMVGPNALAIPFLTNNNGVRCMTASKMQAQAKPLKYREPPLVQAATSEEGSSTVEQVVGKKFCPISPVDGRVKQIKEMKIIIEEKNGTKHEVEVPKKFWLNESNFVDAELLVQVGDAVKKDQPLADTNYTKGGTLSLGVNLNTAYVAYKGYNHEDGVVISERAAEKLTSLHAHQNTVPVPATDVLHLRKYLAYFPSSYRAEQIANLDEEGVIKEGSTINPGDPLVVKMRKAEEDVTSKKLKSISRLLATDFRDASVLYEKDHAGVVAEVTRRRGEIFIVVRTEEKARIGDKLVGRYGNKGTITMIVPNDKMPTNEEGEHMDILLAPPGVSARMNTGQILETNAARVAEREGRPYLARPAGAGGSEQVLKDMARHKLSDSTRLVDPEDGPLDGAITSGKQYFLKLEHQVEKKLSARGAGDDELYSLSGQPSSGGGTGGRAVGLNEMYALLAHGATANMRDMYSFKGDQNPEYWRALEKGYPLPPPDQPASSKRLVGMMRAIGVNIEEQGHMAKMTPFLDRDIKKISNGEIKTPGILRANDLKEESGGLFDLPTTGGLEGEKWTHIKLADPMPHPTFEKSILDLLKMKGSDLDDIMAGRKFVNKQGVIIEQFEPGALSGGQAIRLMLSRIDVPKRLDQSAKEALVAKGSDLNRLNREMRILRNLQDNGVKPQELVVELVPVMPPKFRPIAELPNGDLTIADVNEHYRALILVNDQLKAFKKHGGGGEIEHKAKGQLYEALRGTMGYSQGVVGKPQVKGIAATISGNQPKDGWYLAKTIRRRQDMSGTGVIEPEPKLSMDELGIPENMAWTMFGPLIVKRMNDMGIPKIEAQKQIEERSSAATKALESVMNEHHVIANRAPTLHRLGLMAFRPKLVSGSAIKVPVETLAGFGADFDGDTFGIHVVVSKDANEEAKKMLPSQNLYMPGQMRQKVSPTISQEFVLGLFRISTPVRSTGKMYQTPELAIRAMNMREIKPNDAISVKGIGQSTRTTAGLVAAMEAVPKELRDYQTPLDAKQINKIISATEKKHGTKEMIKVMDHFKHLGRKWAYLTGSSLLLSDMKSLKKERQQLYTQADMKAAKVRSDTRLTPEERDAQLVAIYSEVDAKILGRVKTLGPNSQGERNNLTDLVISGARGNPHQVKQIVGSVGLVMDHRNKVIPEPVRGDYITGLSPRDFWAHSIPSRKGMIDRSQSVVGPGALSKELTNTATRYNITMKDCGTKQGRLEPVDKHMLDRVLLRAAGGINAGAILDDQALDKLNKAKVTHAYVRTPLTCEAPDGLCSMCFGLDEHGKLPEVGRFIGVSEIQAITERSVQLPMKTFHSGGVASAEGGLSSAFERAVQILRMPDHINQKAVLATKAGPVERIVPTGLGSSEVYVAGAKHVCPPDVKIIARVGQVVQKGEALTSGSVKPQELLALKDLNTVQGHVRDDLHQTFSSAGVNLHKRTYEVMVRGLTDQVRITDPGANPSYVAGDYASFAQVKAWNDKNMGKRPIKFTHELAGSLTAPKRTSDWAQRMALGGIKQTIQEGAGMGYESDMRPGSFAWTALGPNAKIREAGREFSGQTYRSTGRY